MSNLLEHNLNEHRALFLQLDILSEPIQRAGVLAAHALQTGHKLMLCGNGGSAADSQHLAAELTGRFVRERRPLAAMALCTDTSALTCIGNDYSFEEIFARQVMALGCPGDVLLALSTSGQSRNVIRAAQEARHAGIHVVGLMGQDGGALRELCDIAIVVPSPITARIQEAHVLLGHTLCGLIEEALGVGQ